jgi:hypothetical protein
MRSASQATALRRAAKDSTQPREKILRLFQTSASRGYPGMIVTFVAGRAEITSVPILG